MNDILTKNLFTKCPLLYTDKNASIQVSLIPFGFECDDGWYKILEDLSLKLEKLIEQYIKEYPEVEYPPRASQVKEKYGTLRFYMSGETDEMSKLIDEAEKLSEKTCEECGEPGRLRGTSWIKTLCNECTK